MEDAELAAIRNKRMQELQMQQKAGGQQQQQQQQEAMKRQEDMINSILTQVLDQTARARLNSIALVKHEKAKKIEAMLVQMAQTGQLCAKMNDKQFLELLQKLNLTEQKTTVKFERRRVMDSDSD